MGLLRLFRWGSRRKEPSKPSRKAVSIVLREREGGLVPHYKILSEGRTWEIPAASMLAAQNRAVDGHNLFVLKKGKRTVVLYGDEHNVQLCRFPETWKKLIDYFEERAETAIKTLVIEPPVKGPEPGFFNTLEKMGLELYRADFPTKAWERYTKAKVKNRPGAKRIAVSEPAELWDIKGTPEEIMLEVRRNAAMAVAAARRSERETASGTATAGLFGGIHAVEVARILQAMGYKKKWSERLSWHEFCSDQEWTRLERRLKMLER